MKLGYARVSTVEQNRDLQESALRNDGTTHVYSDQGVSGASTTRPGLDKCLAALQSGDVLVVWKLDRLGRSLGHLIAVIEALGKRGVGFKSLTEGIDTTTASGKLLFHIMGALAEFERSLIAERTKAGMAAARIAGKGIGRPAKLTRQQAIHARDQVAGGKSKNEVAALLAVSVKTMNLAVGRLPKA